MNSDTIKSVKIFVREKGKTGGTYFTIIKEKTPFPKTITLKELREKSLLSKKPITEKYVFAEGEDFISFQDEEDCCLEDYLVESEENPKIYKIYIRPIDNQENDKDIKIQTKDNIKAESQKKDERKIDNSDSKNEIKDINKENKNDDQNEDNIEDKEKNKDKERKDYPPNEIRLDKSEEIRNNITLSRDYSTLVHENKNIKINIDNNLSSGSEKNEGEKFELKEKGKIDSNKAENSKEKPKDSIKENNIKSKDNGFEQNNGKKKEIPRTIITEGKESKNVGISAKITKNPKNKKMVKNQKKLRKKKQK